MARYIDAEKIKYHTLSMCGGHGLNFEYTVAYKHEVDAIPTAEVAPNSEATTVYERIKAMSLDEMVSFFADLAEKQIIVTADNYICRKCRAEHGGDCPCNDENCLYDLSPEATIRLWLEAEKEMTEGDDGTHEG